MYFLSKKAGKVLKNEISFSNYIFVVMENETSILRRIIENDVKVGLKMETVKLYHTLNILQIFCIIHRSNHPIRMSLNHFDRVMYFNVSILDFRLNALKWANSA